LLTKFIFILKKMEANKAPIFLV
jgi:hypothetical protein